MELETLILLVTLVSSISGLTILGFWFRIRIKQLLDERDGALDELDEAIASGRESRQRAAQLGANSALGSVHELIGKLTLITKYKDWWFLSGPSRQASIDMIAYDGEGLHIIEIKKNGTRLTRTENLVKKSVDEGKVTYEVIDVDLDFDGKVDLRKLSTGEIRNDS